MAGLFTPSAMEWITECIEIDISRENFSITRQYNKINTQTSSQYIHVRHTNK